jgi:glycosyltransferase involved in cell wall biosynthesis
LGPKSDVERYYGLLDVGANLRPDPEPFGLSVIEAMMMGIPVLAHGLGGPAETILHEETGWLLSGVSPDEIAKVLSDAYATRSKLERLGGQAREHALSLFSTEAEYARYIEILEK